MVLEARVRTCELHCNKKKKLKISSTSSTSTSQVRNCGVNFGEMKIFVFMDIKAQVRTCELRSQKKKKKKKDFPNSLDIDVTVPDLWRQFRKNQYFCFCGPKGTCPDL